MASETQLPPEPTPPEARARVALSKERKQEIAQKAEYARSLLLDPFQIPVNLPQIAKELDYKVQYFSPSKPENKEVSGAVNRTQLLVLINKTQNLLRQRFTLAHEIGHILLHSDQEVEVDYRLDTPDLTSVKEVEANYFACCLLLPAEEFKSQWLASEEPDVVRIANHFGVTSIPVHSRAQALGLKK